MSAKRLKTENGRSVSPEKKNDRKYEHEPEDQNEYDRILYNYKYVLRKKSNQQIIEECKKLHEEMTQLRVNQNHQNPIKRNYTREDSESELDTYLKNLDSVSRVNVKIFHKLMTKIGIDMSYKENPLAIINKQ